ncbi:MAG: response regulator transcription factor [Flavobacteriia bacterium]|nr:response regulator transcription factor [Flavobacteriia bacterium]
MKKISIVVVDDSPLMTQAIAEKLSFFDDLNLVKSFQSGSEFLEFASAHKHIDLVLMDIEMPEINGIDLTKMLKGRHPQMKVIMLTVVDADNEIFKAIRAGADGYLLKEVAPQELHDGIVETLAGGASLTPSIALKALQLLRNVEEWKEVDDIEKVKLTPREHDVLRQICQGLDYKAIASNLFISPPTVRKHIENIYGKLHVHSRLEVIEKAKRNNLI